MKSLRLMIVPLLAVVFIFTTAGVYSPIVTAQKKRSAHSKKTAQFHYVCPMHENVTSKSRGICPKCKMKLVRKALPQKTGQ